MLAGLAILPTSAVGIPITAAAAAASIPVASTSIANADAKINAPLMRAEEMVKALREGYCSEDFELDERAAELMLSYLRSRDMWADDSHLSNEELDEDTEKFYRNVADFADRYNQSLDWLVRGDPSVMICSRAAQSQEAAKAVDPIFSVIEACHQADAACLAVAGDIPDEIGQRWSDAEKAVMRTRPTTPSGLAALTTWARQKADWLRANHSCLMEEDFFALTATIDDATRGMSGLKPWEPAAAPVNPDAKLVELGREFERLLAIEVPHKDEHARLSEESSRLHGTKLGYDPDDQQAMRNFPWDDWNNAWKEADKETGRSAAWHKWNQASARTARVGRKILKIKPKTKEGFLLRVRVIETHDEICKMEPVDQLLAEINNFAELTA